jgi:hypothetical protein
MYIMVFNVEGMIVAVQQTNYFDTGGTQSLTLSR